MSKPTFLKVTDEQIGVLCELRNKMAQSSSTHENDYIYNVLGGLIKDLKAHSILTLKTTGYPHWQKAKAGRNLGKDAIVIYDGDPDARLERVSMVRCAINDCKFIYIEDLLNLPTEE